MVNRKMKFLKKFILYILIFGNNIFLYAFLSIDYGGNNLPQWKLQAYYQEKYFEYNINYRYYDKIENYRIESEEEMLKGIKQNFGLNLGLPNNYTLTVDFLYVFQKMNEINHNDFQEFTIYLEKNNENDAGLLTGIRVPIWNKEIENPKIITGKDKFNLILGFYYNISKFIFKNQFFALIQMPLEYDMDYTGEFFLGEIFGINLFDDKEKQSIDLLCELSLNNVDYFNEPSITGFIIPQLKISFYTDFQFIIGLQILAHAEDVFLNDTEKYLYIVKLNYIINSEKRQKQMENYNSGNKFQGEK